MMMVPSRRSVSWGLLCVVHCPHSRTPGSQFADRSDSLHSTIPARGPTSSPSAPGDGAGCSLDRCGGPAIDWLPPRLLRDSPGSLAWAVRHRGAATGNHGIATRSAREARNHYPVFQVECHPGDQPAATIARRAGLATGIFRTRDSGPEGPDEGTHLHRGESPALGARANWVMAASRWLGAAVPRPYGNLSALGGRSDAAPLRGDSRCWAGAACCPYRDRRAGLPSRAAACLRAASPSVSPNIRATSLTRSSPWIT